MALPPIIELADPFADPELSGTSISTDGTRLAHPAPAHGRTDVCAHGIDEQHGDAVGVTHDARRGISKHHWTRGFQNPENVITLWRAVERHFAEHLGGCTDEEDER